MRDAGCWLLGVQRLPSLKGGSSLEKVVLVAGITVDTYQGFNQVPISLHKYL
jgi:hypothetical protein